MHQRIFTGHVVQPVRTEQQYVAREKVDDVGFDFDRILRSNRLGQNVAVRMRSELLVGQARGPCRSR